MTVKDERTMIRRVWDAVVGNPSPLKREFERQCQQSTSRLMPAATHGTDDQTPPQYQRRPMKRVGLLTVLCVILAIAGCSVQASYVEADKATFDAVAPDYLKLIEASDRTDAQKEMARLVVESWALRIAEAQKKQGTE